MKTIKARRFVAAALVTMLAPVVLAGNSYIANDWGVIDKFGTGTIILDAEGRPNKRGFLTKIDFTASGKKRVFFTTVDLGSDACRVDSFKDQFLITVNGQVIKAFGWCKKAPTDTYHHVQFTAATDEGGKFIIDAFLNSPKEVAVSYFGENFGVSSVGFSKAWNSVGGDAL